MNDFLKPLIIALLLTFTCYSQSGTHELQSRMNELITDRFFESTTIAVDIYDLSEDESLYRFNEKLLLHPASTMKIISTSAGLHFLPRDYTFRTELFHTGIISEDTLYGDLYIVGGFDPLFRSEDVDSMAGVIKSLGIKKITGNIFADISVKDSLYWGKGWNWDDDPDPDAPYLSALNINSNVIEVFLTGSENDSPVVVKINPETGYVKIVNNAKTVSEDVESDFTVTRDWVNRTNTIFVDGVISKREIQDSLDHLERINLINPEYYFLTLFKEHLQKNDVSVGGKIGVKKLPENNAFLTSIRRLIDSVIVAANKESDNLSAEMILYALAMNDSGVPALNENGLEAINRFISEVGLEPGDYSFADGSGVSRYNLVSTELMIEVLKYIYYDLPDLFPLFYNSLSVGGVDGTLESRFENSTLKGNVHAKTGTLTGVSNLAGYLTAKNDHLIAFVIMIQNYTGKNFTARNFQEIICDYIAEYK